MVSQSTSSSRSGHSLIFRVATSGGLANKVVAMYLQQVLVLHARWSFPRFAHSSLTTPPKCIGPIRTVAKRRYRALNRELMSRANLYPAEEMEWTGALGEKVHGFLKPTNFDASKKYPLVVLIHGGPQGAWNDSWSYRWNPQVFANNGYIAFAPNPRGSTGYGQKSVNEISGDWGGKVYTDLMNGVAEVLRRNRFIDRTRIGAADAHMAAT